MDIESANKINIFLMNQPFITIKRQDEIQEEWREIFNDWERGRITKESRDEKHDALSKEDDKACLDFEEFKEFQNSYSAILRMRGVSPDVILAQIKHEKKHSEPYYRDGIKSKFGIRKLENGFQAYHQPYGKKYDSLSNLDISRLQYVSLKIVVKPSFGDKNSSKSFENKFGKDTCEKWLKEYLKLENLPEFQE